MANLVERNLCQCIDSIPLNALRPFPLNRVHPHSQIRFPPFLKLRKVHGLPSYSARMASKTSRKQSKGHAISTKDTETSAGVSVASCYRNFFDKVLSDPAMSCSIPSGAENPTDADNSRQPHSACDATQVSLKLSSLKLGSGVGSPVQRPLPSPYRRTSSVSNPSSSAKPPPTPTALPRRRRASMELRRTPSAQAGLAGATAAVPFKACPSRDATFTPGRHRRHSVESSPFTASFYLGASNRLSQDTPENAGLKPILKGGTRPSSCAPGRTRNAAREPAVSRSASSLGHRETVRGKTMGSRAGGATVRAQSPGPKFSYRLDPNLAPADVKRVTFNDDVAVVGSDGIRRRRHSSPSLVVSPGRLT